MPREDRTDEKEQLIADVIAQIEKDFEYGDTSALAEMLSKLSDEDLIAYIPEASL